MAGSHEVAGAMAHSGPAALAELFGEPGILQQIDPSSSSGDNGIQAGVYKAFPEFFVRNMYRANQEIEVEGLPEEWVTALARSLPKDPTSTLSAVPRPNPYPQTAGTQNCGRSNLLGW